MSCPQHPFSAMEACQACGEPMCLICACAACRRDFANVVPLRVASWNIKTLGKQFLHNQPAVIELLAAIMLRMEADVICLMEVMEGFGPRHAVSIVEAMKKMSDTPWRVQFPATYTGAGGRNGLETYAVVYNAEMLELTSFELVGEEIGYSRGESGTRQPDPKSTVVTRRPAQAVFRPLPTCHHFAFYPEFRVIIFHAPSVANKDYHLACHAIGELIKLPVFAMPGKYPYTILCADLNIDEEAGNHVRRREGQDFDEFMVKSREQGARDLDRYNAAYDNYASATDKLKTHREQLATALKQKDSIAQLVQNSLDLQMCNAEHAAALQSKGKKQQQRLSKAIEKLELLRIDRAKIELLNTVAQRGHAKTILKLRDDLEQAVMVAKVKLDEAEEVARLELPTAEEEVLEATEAAFEPLTNTDMLSNLGYSDDFRTTLRMSIHMACTRRPRAEYYDRELTFESFVYSNFDQVLVRASDGSAWGELSASVINLVGAVMPEHVRIRLGVGTPLPASTPVRRMTADEQSKRVFAKIYAGNPERLQEHKAQFGEDLTGINLDENVPDADPVNRDYSPIEDVILEDFLADPDVYAAALVSAFKRFVDMNNSHPDIDMVREEARRSALADDPVEDFLGKPNVWQNRSRRNAVRYVEETQKSRLFEINVYLALANMLSDHLPVIVEIEMVEPKKARPRVQAAPPRFSSLFGAKVFSPVVLCSSSSSPGPCRNLANCCGTCDERTSLKTADGCLTGYQLVRAAASVCQQFLSMHPLDMGYQLLRNSSHQIVGGCDWTAMAGHLLYIKGLSGAFAIDRGFEYFWQNPSITIGLAGIRVERELCSVNNVLAARKHPRILFAKVAAQRPTAAAAQTVAGTGDEDDVDVQDENGDEGKADWSYPTIAKKFAIQSPMAFAQDVLSFLKTGYCPTDDSARAQALAALLVTVFGVEANKDNSTYLTGILLLLGMQTQRYTIAEVFAQVDPSNECNLAGSLGLFPLASSDRANLYGKRRCLSGRAIKDEDEWSEAKIMTAMLNIEPRSRDNIILKKEMVLLVDDVRVRFKAHPLTNSAKLLQAAKTAWWELLHVYYGTPPK